MRANTRHTPAINESLGQLVQCQQNSWITMNRRTTITQLIRPPGTTVPDGLMVYSWCTFFFLFRQSFSELPRPIALKLCHMIGIWKYFIIPLQTFGGGRSPPQKKKKIGAKNMLNFGQFWTTSEFDREYLRNRWRYAKSENSTNYGNSSCV